MPSIVGDPDHWSIIASTDHCSGQTLAPKQTCTVQVRLTTLPSYGELHNATLRFDSNAPGSPTDVALEALTNCSFRQARC